MLLRNYDAVNKLADKKGRRHCESHKQCRQ